MKLKFEKIMKSLLQFGDPKSPNKSPKILDIKESYNFDGILRKSARRRAHKKIPIKFCTFSKQLEGPKIPEIPDNSKMINFFWVFKYDFSRLGNRKPDLDILIYLHGLLDVHQKPRLLFTSKELN